jgi:hypothetical protein
MSGTDALIMLPSMTPIEVNPRHLPKYKGGDATDFTRSTTLECGGLTPLSSRSMTIAKA